MPVITSDARLNKTDHSAVEKQQQILLPLLSVDLVYKQSQERVVVEQFIANHFYKSHQAEVHTFLPYLLTSRTKKNIISTIGFRLGVSDEIFFLEQYLSCNVETTLSQLMGSVVERRKIAEIGNLTSSYPAASQLLFVLIVAVLYKAGFEWALFTATPQVQKMVDDLGIVSHQVCVASPEFLPDRGESWGGYYKNKPTVIAGQLSDAFAKLSTHPVASFMLCHYQRKLDAIIQQLV